MKWIKRIFGTLIVLIVALIGVAFLLPNHVEVSRSIMIAAPPEQIYPYISNFRKFNEWSPWAKHDAETQYTFEGPEEGAGHKMTWKSDHPQVGSGSQEITAADANKSVDVALDFGRMGQGKAHYTLQPDGAGSKVTLEFETDLGNNPLIRFSGLMIDSQVGAAYESGLTALKVLVESQTDGSG